MRVKSQPTPPHTIQNLNIKERKKWMNEQINKTKEKKRTSSGAPSGLGAVGRQEKVKRAEEGCEGCEGCQPG